MRSVCLLNCGRLDADGSWEDVNIAEYIPEMDSTAHS